MTCMTTFSFYIGLPFFLFSFFYTKMYIYFLNSICLEMYVYVATTLFGLYYLSTSGADPERVV